MRPLNRTSFLLKNRFFKKVTLIPFHECWEWIGVTTNGGYGRIRLDNKMLLAHRVAYELFKGPIPNQKDICHKCDNPPCVNPNHLFIGTPIDNMRDMYSKKRRKQSGENNGNSKLTESDVHRIRRLYNSKISQSKIAKIFGMGQTSVSNIIIGRTWNQK